LQGRIRVEQTLRQRINKVVLSLDQFSTDAKHAQSLVEEWSFLIANSPEASAEGVH